MDVGVPSAFAHYRGLGAEVACSPLACLPTKPATGSNKGSPAHAQVAPPAANHGALSNNEKPAAGISPAGLCSHNAYISENTNLIPMSKHWYAMPLGLLLLSCTATQPQASSAPADKGLAAKVKDFTKYEGYFDFYWDDKAGKIWLEVDHFDEEFLYVNSLPAGVGSNDIGLDRGQLGGERVVKFVRVGPKVLLVEPNLRYRATSDNAAEVAAVRDAFAQSVHDGFKVEAEENGRVLIDITDFLLRDAHGVAQSLKRSGQGSYSRSADRCAMYLPRTKNFPENTEFEATITFTGQPSGGYIRSVAADAEAVTVRMHHSFIQLPDDKYTPREYDPRGGFFGISYADYATPIGQPLQKRFIARHRLEKKDPNAAMSEPVEPIIYYLDPGTPEPVRSALLDGARWWNQAFEAAGYKDAFRVEMLPEDADPMDVRYNVIQWVHRSTRGWSYGASVTDPRTGEIIKGHVSLGSLRVRQDYLIAEAILAPYKEGEEVPEEMLEFALARLRQLSAHEVGHTLGLAHNYIASTHDRASVMDYPHPLVLLDEEGNFDLSGAYDVNIGEWDKVAVTYGYADYPEGTDEQAEAERLLLDAHANGLRFISDQDARPAGGAHALAHLWDSGEDPAAELVRVLKVRQKALTRFGENNLPEGTPMAMLEQTLVPLYLFHRYQVEAAVKLVGGYDYTYAMRGDGQEPLTMVDPAQQRRALKSLLETLQPHVLAIPESVLQQLPPMPMGYSRDRESFRGRTNVIFDPLVAAENGARLTLSLLLNAERANRLVLNASYDANAPSLEEVLDELMKATWLAPRVQGYAGEIQRTVNLTALRHLMNLALDDDASDQTRAWAYNSIRGLDMWLNNRRLDPPAWEAHDAYTKLMIKQWLDNPEPFALPTPAYVPPGSPIGTDACGY